MGGQPTDAGGASATSRARGVPTLLLALAFAALAAATVWERTTAFDLAALEWMGRAGTPTLDRWAAGATNLGAWIVVATTALVLSAFLWAGGERHSVLLLWVGLVGATLLNETLKATFARPRPDVFAWRVPHARGWAFPSGHALNASVAYTLFAWLLGRLGGSRPLRAAAWGVAGALILLVGATRVYLGVHFPSDVLAGVLAGLAWALLCIAALERPRSGRNAR